MRAQNERYQQQLDKVYDLRGSLSKNPSNADALKADLAEALGKAMSLAQEAYHTSGAVRDIVCNLQMGLSLELDMCERLNSFNEQVGDIWKDYGQIPKPTSPTSDIDFAVDASKYVMRMARVAIGACADVVTAIAASAGAETGSRPEWLVEDPRSTVNRLLNLQEIAQEWRKAVQFFLHVKDAPDRFKTGNDWNQDVIDHLAKGPWTGGETSRFLDLLRYLTHEVNVYVRAAAAPSPPRDRLSGRAAELMRSEFQLQPPNRALQ